MTREHRQAQMEAFGAAVLAEDYGGVPEGWGLRQICGAGFGAKKKKKKKKKKSWEYVDDPQGPGKFILSRRVPVELNEKGLPPGYALNSLWGHIRSLQDHIRESRQALRDWKNLPTQHGRDVMEEEELFLHYGRPELKEKYRVYKAAGGKRRLDPKKDKLLPGGPSAHYARRMIKEHEEWMKELETGFGQGPWPGVDVSLQSGIQDYGSLWSQAAMDITQGKVTEADIDDAGPDAAEAIVALQNAINSLWGASGQLERTQRGRARGGRYRHRRLVQDMELLLTSFFRGATDTQGKPITWEDVVTELPATSIGPAVFNFGAKLPTYVPVEAEVGIIRLSIPSILTAGDVIELANDVSKTADDIRDLAFTWQSRGQGIPQIPSDFIMRSLSQQSSLVPSNVFTVGATRTSQCISRKSGMGYPRRQAVAMCLNMEREGRLGPRGEYRRVQP